MPSWMRMPGWPECKSKEIHFDSGIVYRHFSNGPLHRSFCVSPLLNSCHSKHNWLAKLASSLYMQKVSRCTWPIKALRKCPKACPEGAIDCSRRAGPTTKPIQDVQWHVLGVVMLVRLFLSCKVCGEALAILESQINLIVSCPRPISVLSLKNLVFFVDAREAMAPVPDGLKGPAALLQSVCFLDYDLSAPKKCGGSISWSMEISSSSLLADFGSSRIV